MKTKTLLSLSFIVILLLALTACASTAPALLEQTQLTTQQSDSAIQTNGNGQTAGVAPADGSGNQFGKNGGGNGQHGRQNTVEPLPTPEIDPGTVEMIDCLICDVDLSSYTGDLTPDEINGLLLALNDEYHAWATYDQVLKDFGDVIPFSNIINAEAQHISMLETLFNTYGVPIPENPWIGNAPQFASTTEACEAGVQAEIENAALYDNIFSSTQRDDILTVYQSLQSASWNQHLPAFQRCAAGQTEDGFGGGQGQHRGGRWQNQG